MNRPRLQALIHHHVHSNGAVSKRDGFSLVESLVMTVVVLLAVGSSALILNSASRMAISHRLQVALNENIESYLSQASALGDSYTCCAGACSTNPPAFLATQTGGDTTSSCATNDPRDDRYFFPYQDDEDTKTPPPSPFNLNTCKVGASENQPCAREPDLVTEICKDANVLLGQLQTEINNLPSPANTTVNTAIKPSKIIRITITDTKNNRVVRVFDLYPPMARFCT